MRPHLGNFGDQFDILLTDFYEYESKEKFDAIVIMGVIEHLPDYKRVLKKVYHLLKPGGFVFLDGSATRKKYELSTFMVRHIYAGNHSCLVLDDLLHELAKTDLELLQVQNDRWSYSLTFKQWALNLEANKNFVQRTFGDFEFRKFRLSIGWYILVFRPQSRLLSPYDPKAGPLMKGDVRLCARVKVRALENVGSVPEPEVISRQNTTLWVRD